MKLKSIKILENQNIPYRLIKLSEKGVSFNDVIKYAENDINPDEICKTIVVKDKKGNKYAFFLKGSDKVDFFKAKEIIGQKISIVSYDGLVRATGTEPGAICPLLLDMPIYVDKRIFETEKINFGSGDHIYGLEINSKDLDKLIKFQICDIS
ncbi:prolyl-tRNA synthetase [archaeon BMS3Abin17]|nr:prolyl-tRNA synthetase [archaeon BMS3Abin17]HDZ60329.1 YbaK/EbsC family protein [Candidatus Pacearchaeota archaeon]